MAASIVDLARGVRIQEPTDPKESNTGLWFWPCSVFMVLTRLSSSSSSSSILISVSYYSSHLVSLLSFCSSFRLPLVMLFFFVACYYLSCRLSASLLLLFLSFYFLCFLFHDPCLLFSFFLPLVLIQYLGVFFSFYICVFSSVSLLVFYFFFHVASFPIHVLFVLFVYISSYISYPVFSFLLSFSSYYCFPFVFIIFASGISFVFLNVRASWLMQ
jgi:hypothetical protein